ncbi:MAG TPA: dipicolinate synthase subunit B [Firmicutes bacterium]|jgi:dipicolinate synthase subunit B|nr:dipicolinate synthase subunit B [Bacillota bacterium]
MGLAGTRIGLALTGSHCTIDQVFPQINRLVESGAIVIPIITPSVDQSNTRFSDAGVIKARLAAGTGNDIIRSIVDAEPIGPQKLLDLLIVAPCTGNTLAKLANGIIDTAVLMAVKSHLRNLRPVLLAISTNDGLGLNARNIGVLLSAKNIFMVPFGQDEPLQKPNSLVSKMDLLPAAAECALRKEQLQPLLVFHEFV